MNERLKNTIFGAIAFGLGFSILQLILSIYFYPFVYLGEALLILVPMFLSILSLGALIGFIFGFKRIDRRKFVWSGIWSFGLIAGILLPVTAAFTAFLFYGIAYVLQYSSSSLPQDSLAFWLIDGIPYQVYGALFGILSGLINGSIFGRRRGSVFKIAFWGAFGFGLGGYLMGWIAPIDTYLGSFNPIGFLQRIPPSTFLLNRILGSAIFGVLGGAALGYFLDTESANR